MGAAGRRRGSLLVLAMLVALMGAGCGSDKPADTGAQSGGGAKLSGLVTGGFEVDLAKEIAKRLGLSGPKFVEMPFTGLVAGQKCKCDIDFSQVTITPDRAKVVQFTDPYFDANQGILVRKGTKVTSLAEAKALKWGAQLNTTGAAYIIDTIKPTTEARLFNTTVDAF